jgi:hypothetical protein
MHRETKERMCRASSIWCCEPEVFWGHHTPFEFQIAGAYIPGCLQPFTLCRGSPKLLIKYKMFNFNKGKGETVLRWIYLSTWSWDWFKNSFKSSYRLGEVNIDHTACWRSITNGWIASVGILDVVTGQQMGFQVEICFGKIPTVSYKTQCLGLVTCLFSPIGLFTASIPDTAALSFICIYLNSLWS